MTNGDVLFYLSIVVTALTSLWASILVTGLVFSNRVRHAAQLLENAPGRAIGTGALLALLGVGLGVLLLNAKNGLLMLFGFVLLAVTLSVALMGSAGLARVLSARMQGLAPTQSPLASLARGGALLIAVGVLPAVGWFLLFPLQLFAALGAGLHALRAGQTRASRQETSALAEPQRQG